MKMTARLLVTLLVVSRLQPRIEMHRLNKSNEVEFDHKDAVHWCRQCDRWVEQTRWQWCYLPAGYWLHRRCGFLERIAIEEEDKTLPLRG